jgi:MFS family permease
MHNAVTMTRLERRATLSLAAVFGLRMFGMFSILPVLAIHAQSLPDGVTPFLIGLALGVDGLAQAFLQIPFGLLSDRIGRKPVIYLGLLLFAVGSFVAALAPNIYIIILGRLLQGTGAVASAIIALIADLTREEHRSKSMAVIGMTIGITFGASLAVGPALAHWVGVPGIFALTGVLAFAAMAVVRYVVPDPAVSRIHADAETVPAMVSDVLRNTELQRLNFGIFSLHAGMRGLFVVVPLLLLDVGGMPVSEHWMIYLPIMAASFIGAVPAIIVAEARGKMKPVFVSAVGLLFVSTLSMALLVGNFTGILVSLFLFFLAFNLLEATLPSLVSKIAPSGSKGTAIGVYNSFQFFGLFLGGALGGFLAQHIGGAAVFVFAAGLAAAWLMLAISMQPPPAVRTRLYEVGAMSEARGKELSKALAHVGGVVEAVVIASEGVAYLKVKMGGWDESGALQLMKQGK